MVFTESYANLPNYLVDRSLFGDSGTNPETNYLLAAAHRTLTSRKDFYEFPQGQKLLQANGICFAGKWIIDRPSPFTGQFSYPTESLVMARASVLLSGTKQKDKRGFGFALKIIKGPDPNKVVPTLNAFVMHSMAGTRSQYVLDLVLDNEPPLGSLPPFGQPG